MTGNEAVWQLGVFQPLLHHVPADARELTMHGMLVRFATCGRPTRPTDASGALVISATMCDQCLKATTDSRNP